MMTRTLLPLTLVLAAAATTVASDEPDLSTVDRRTPVVRAVEAAGPSVVNISTRSVRTTRAVPRLWGDLPDVFRDRLSRMFPPRRHVTGSLGSGVILTETGYICTNAHVVSQADEIVVTLADETQLDAELVIADTESDLAVIKIQPTAPLQAVRLGISSDLMIGETVIAVGNPFGYQRTVTTGVLSALDRTIQASADIVYTNLIQTDAPINPGNSGGPLLNIRGELIGINTAIRAGAQGLGFAIPVDTVREIMTDLLRVRRAGGAWFGAAFRAERRDACEIARVDKGSPAEKAGLEPLDRIVAIDGHAVTCPIELETRLLERQAGETLRLEVLRGGTRRRVDLTLAEVPRPQGEKLAKALFGLDLQALTPELADTLHLMVEEGLVVAGVEPGSPAQQARFQVGDVLIQAGRFRVADLDTLGQILAQVRKGDAVPFYVVRAASVMRTRMKARADGNEVF